MKIATWLLLAVPSVAAFAPVAFVSRRVETHLAARPDATAAIEAALSAVKQFGPTSPEARVAWEAVEEMDDSSSIDDAVKPSLAEECVLTEEQYSEACKDYSEKLETLSQLLKEYTPKLGDMKSVVDEMKAIKVTVYENQPGPDSPAIRAALANAKEAEAKFGADSSEAKLAWEELEEVASAGLESGAGARRLDEECLVESAEEACLALEELNRVLNLQQTKLSGLNS